MTSCYRPQAIADCREKASALPDRTEEVTRLLDGITQQHQNMLETVQVGRDGGYLPAAPEHAGDGAGRQAVTAKEIPTIGDRVQKVPVALGILFFFGAQTLLSIILLVVN